MLEYLCGGKNKKRHFWWREEKSLYRSRNGLKTFFDDS